MDASIAQIKADNAEVLVSAMIQQSVAANGLKEVVSLINKGIMAERAERDKLIETDPTNPRIREIDIDIASSIVRERHYAKAIAAAESGVLPTATSTFTTTPPSGNIPLSITISMNESSPKELQQQLAQLRKDYEAADAQAHQLAVQLQQTPDEAKNAELRKAVQRAFTARQSLLRTELMEMQTRLLQTQRSIDLRERISDQIIQRRVEDMLNPQLEWEGTPTSKQRLLQSEVAQPDEQEENRIILPASKPQHPIKAQEATTLPRDSITHNVTWDQLKTLFQTILKRHPTPREIEAWQNSINSGQSLRDVEITLLSHNSVFDRVDRDKQRYIEYLHEYFLNRKLTASELDYWTQRYDQAKGIRSVFILEFAEIVQGVLQNRSVDNADFFTDPKAEVLAKLQGTWNVELDAADIQFPGTRGEVTIEGNLLKLWEIVPPQPGLTTETIRTEAGAMLLTPGAAGPPQQIDLVIGPNDGDERRETQGIIEITGDTVKLCYDPQHTKGEVQRPVAFAIGKHAELLVFKRQVKASQNQGAPQVPSVNPKIAILAMLQGKLTVETTVIQDGKTTISKPITAVGEETRIQFPSEDGQPPMSIDFILGSAGPPQQVDLRPIPKFDTDEISKKGVPKELFPFWEAEILKLMPLLPGIVEVDDDCVRISFAADPSVSKARPTEFKAGPYSVTWEFRPQAAAAAKVTPSAAVTELEGDWHFVSANIRLKKGETYRMPPTNRTFQRDRLTVAWPGGGHDCRIKVNLIEKSIRLYDQEENGTYTLEHYELKGNQLILRHNPEDEDFKVYERGLVRIPSVVPPATEEQKLLWRSAIVEIATYGDSHVNNGGENVVGRGVVVSPGGLILAHLAGRWDPPLKDRKVMAKYDDGSQIPLTVVEEGGGFVAFQPEKPINVNHYFKVSQTVVQEHDEVRIWGPDHSRAGSQSLAPYADSVTVLDRKYPALGIAVWQLRSSQHAVLGTPILDADGDLLGITITGTRDLLLAVPVAQLKALFPKSLGQLTPMPSDTPPAAPTVSPLSPAVPVPVAPQSEGP